MENEVLMRAYASNRNQRSSIAKPAGGSDEAVTNPFGRFDAGFGK